MLEHLQLMLKYGVVVKFVLSCERGIAIFALKVSSPMDFLAVSGQALLLLEEFSALFTLVHWWV